MDQLTAPNYRNLYERSGGLINQGTGCRLIHFPCIENTQGNLTFIEGMRHVPFEVKRVYYISDIPVAAQRGGHAHKELEQVIIALSGSFDVEVKTGSMTNRYHLNSSSRGLYIPKMVWREIENFSPHSVCLVLASAFFEEDDYHRSFGGFLAALEQRDTDE